MKTFVESIGVVATVILLTIGTLVIISFFVIIIGAILQEFSL